MLDAEDVKSGVPIATLGSIAILIASFLEKEDFIVNYAGSLPTPFPLYVLSGILLLLSSGAYLLYTFNEREPKWMHTYFFEFPLFLGLLTFFASSIITLLIYLH